MTSVLFSIAASQILLGLALMVILLRGPLRFPPGSLPLGLFFLWTVATKVRAEGWLVWNPQIRKFFVFLVLAVIFSAVANARQARNLLLGVVAAGWLSAAWSGIQFAQRVAQAHAAGLPFYEFYTPRRTTGFMSHWMTFAGEMLVVLLIGVAFLLFSGASPRQRWVVGVGTLLTGNAILLNQTRSVWLAAAGALVYLIAVWRPRWLWALPLALSAVLALSPESVQQRALSLLRPHQATDSNLHRFVTWRTGLAMVRANPIWGVGPQQVEGQFLRYVPADVPRPLPEGWYGHLHNVYLQIAAERGLPGLGLLLWWLTGMAAAWLRGLSRAVGEARFLLHTALAVWLGTMISALFEHNLGNSEVLHLFLAVSATGFVALREQATATPPTPPPAVAVH